jgi:hypothetical protein
MKNIFYKSLLILGISIFAFSCFEDEDDGYVPSGTCNVDSYINAYMSAVNTFNANPNYTNCVNLKNKALSLLNAIHACDYYEDTEYWEDAIAAWNNVNCQDLL